ncbi:hypothetical protein M413DRAFT_166742 [Hebeloma cylindrosporum]|uniref:Transmembrane protein n=1 Tax=Hebeloma cylindrosporum TaxID=76867 RepID=A0A0C2XSP7_HEBCY|nr:hypothetical protein M413DRAFT_166742 [Hebeloma cylindrosporum h7]
MVNGTPVDHSCSYSAPGSTIDLDARQSSRPSCVISSKRADPPWHPKLTLYRLLVILSTLGLAAVKTVTSYLDLSFASITLEWILGVVVFLFFHILSAYEETSNKHLIWLFNYDYMEYLWVFLEKSTGFHRPYYISDEIDTRDQAEVGIHPHVTGYRIIVTLVVASGGFTKSALLYGQKDTEATTLECLFGVAIAAGLDWLGLYEASSTKVYPKLFHVDYSGGTSNSITEAGIVFLHLSALIGCSALSYGFYLLALVFLPGDSPSKSNNGRGILRMIVSNLFVGVNSFISLAFAMGVFVLLYQIGRRDHASLLGRCIARLSGVRLILYVRRTYWLPSGISFHPRPRLFYLKRLIIRQAIKIPMNLALLCGLILTVIFFLVGMLVWCSLAINLLKGGPWYLLLVMIHFLLSLFVIPTFLFLCGIIIQLGYKGVVDHFSGAWKDLR